MTREETIAELNVLHERLSNPKDCEEGCYSWEDGWYVEAIDMAIEALSDRPTDEWCTDCKEYDHEKHCCPRFNRVIRTTLNEVVRCKDCRFYSNDHLCEQLSRFGSIEPLADFCCAFGERRDP